MSAYVCDNKTISQVVDFLLADWVRLFKGETPQSLGVMLHAMNCAAVAARYEGREGKAPGFKYECTPYPVPLAQSIKTLECLKYQCSEGDIPKEDLYQSLESVLSGAKDTLLRQVCPEYDRAEWGAYEPKQN